jgi:acyl-CoA reductase-like NAD-dependent aldehyde dehydrogenase
MARVKETEVNRPPPTSREDLDSALEELTAHKQEWVDLPIGERLDLVRRVRRDFHGVQERWVQLSVAAKGVAERTYGNDWDWLDVAPINRTHLMVERALSEIKKGRRPKVPGGYHTRPGGQVVARTYPDSKVHEQVFKGITQEVWLEPGVTLEEARSNQADAYFGGITEGRLALVLGAGNASSLIPSDTFHKMFHDLQVVVLKMNPVNSYLGPLLEKAYGGLIDRGFLRIVHGGAGEGRYLVDHPLVDEAHMTGSDRTFEAVVFGPGADGAERKAKGAPIVDKTVNGELGCITPWVMVPGEWSKAEVGEQAAKMAYWMMRHEGYICFAPRVLVLWKRWRHRRAFIEALVDALSKVEPIRAYYPGSIETQQAFVSAHPDAIQIGGGLEDHVPWTVIPDVDPGARDDICFCRESFSGMVAESALEGATVSEFIDNTVAFLNDTVWGTLSATLVVSEESMADPATGQAVERAIGDLRYGTVGLNAPGTWGFYAMTTPWGGFPGSTITDIQSGTAKVANFLMLHRPQKSVVRAPFKMEPYPFLGTAKDLQVFSRKLARFEEGPSWLQLPGLYFSAKRTAK